MWYLGQTQSREYWAVTNTKLVWIRDLISEYVLPELFLCDYVAIIRLPFTFPKFLYFTSEWSKLKWIVIFVTKKVMEQDPQHQACSFTLGDREFSLFVASCACTMCISYLVINKYVRDFFGKIKKIYMNRGDDNLDYLP